MNAPLRVAILAQLLPGSAGGIESNLLDLLHYLARAEGAVRPIVIGPGEASDWLGEHVGAAGVVLPWPPIRYRIEDSWLACERARMPMRLAIKLRRGCLLRLPGLGASGHHVASGRKLSGLLAARGIELIHFPYQRYFETDIPFIFEPWDLQHVHCPENFSDQERRFRDHLYREACLRAALVVVPTRWGKKDAASSLGIDERKIAVIPRGPGATLPPANAAAAPRLPSRYVAYPAKFWPHKNHLRLFEALALLRATGCVVPLVCTGDPATELPDRLRKAIARLDLEDQVVFLGHLERDILSAVLSRAEIVVFPSLFEGYGIPVAEAMILGVPVVCSRIGPLEELAQGAAEMFDPLQPEDIASSIERLWVSADRRDELRRRGMQRARAFDGAQFARDFILCYKSVAGRTLAEEERSRLALLLGGT